MQTSEQLGELAGALAKAQGSFEAVERNREVEVKMKTGGKYSFSYATLDAIVESVRKPLADNGLSYVQGVDGSENGSVVETMLMHSSGQWVRTVIPVHAGGNDNRAQAMGSGITYAKRYALTAILGIVAEDDDDGNEADGNTVTKVERPKSNRSADNPNWRGPLNKSELKKQLSAFANELRAVTDVGSFVGLLTSHSAILDQCPADLPEWWVHSDGGIKQAVLDTGLRLEAKVGTYLDGFERASEKKPVQKQAAE